MKVNFFRTTIGQFSFIWEKISISVLFGINLTVEFVVFLGSRQFCLAQEVPRNPEALRLHRNTLTMELLWLQQAIDSRKKVEWMTREKM